MCSRSLLHLMVIFVKISRLVIPSDNKLPHPAFHIAVAHLVHLFFLRRRSFRIAEVSPRHAGQDKSIVTFPHGSVATITVLPVYAQEPHADRLDRLSRRHADRTRLGLRRRSAYPASASMVYTAATDRYGFTALPHIVCASLISINLFSFTRTAFSLSLANRKCQAILWNC